MASPQLPDYIIYQKDTIPIYELLLKKHIEQLKSDEQDRLSLIEEAIVATNCARGYQTIYQVENDSLFVVGIITCNSINHIDTAMSQRNLSHVFGNKVKEGKVLLDWLDGEISFPVATEKNEIVSWDGVFEYVFLYETLLQIKQGKVMATTLIENYVDDIDAINRKKADQVAKIILEKLRLYKWKKLEQFDCSSRYAIRINKAGIIDQVKIVSPEIKMLSKQEARECRHCLNSLNNALKDLQFDIIKRKEVPVEEEVFIELLFASDGSIRSNVD